MSDLIDRQAAIQWVKTECNQYGKPTLDFESGKRVIEHLKQLPSAQAERKTGRWIKDPQKSKFHIEPVYICSFCREQEAWGQMELSNYCPNCGAKMEEVTG